MEITTGVQAHIEMGPGSEQKIPGTDEVRTVLFAAFPALMGQPGVEIEQMRGLEGAWLVTLPTGELEQIEEAGLFEIDTKMSNGDTVKMEIELP